MCGLLDSYFSGRRDVTATAEDMLGDGLPARLDWLESWLGGLARRGCSPMRRQSRFRRTPYCKGSAAK